MHTLFCRCLLHPLLLRQGSRNSDTLSLLHSQQAQPSPHLLAGLQPGPSHLCAHLSPASSFRSSQQLRSITASPPPQSRSASSLMQLPSSLRQLPSSGGQLPCASPTHPFPTGAAQNHLGRITPTPCRPSRTSGLRQPVQRPRAPLPLPAHQHLSTSKGSLTAVQSGHSRAQKPGERH